MTPVQAAEGQKAAPPASPCPTTAAPGQTPTATPQTPRPQQGQVKLTMAQLMQLTQSAQVSYCFSVEGSYQSKNSSSTRG